MKSSLLFLWDGISEQEDGAKVVRVENMDNPYKHQDNFDKRFKLSLNKLYAWSLVDYDRVVMLDADNLFLQNTDELFQCGQFCAVFINPCVFHTGLFVLQVNLPTWAKNVIIYWSAILYDISKLHYLYLVALCLILWSFIFEEGKIMTNILWVKTILFYNFANQKCPNIK